MDDGKLEELQKGLAYELLQLLRESAVALAGMEMDEHISASELKRSILSVFSRGRELAISTAVLVEREKPTAAFVLQRPLFEDSVLLACLAKADDTERTRIMARWMSDSTHELEALVRKVEKYAPSDTAFIDMASGIVKWRRQQLSRLASTGVKLAPSPEWPKLMERVGRRDDVLDWITSNQAVHGNELIHLMGLGMRDGDVQVVGQPTPFLLSVVSVMAIGSALPLMRDASTLFGIPKPGNWSELELRRTKLVDLLNTDPGLIDPGQIPG